MENAGKKLCDTKPTSVKKHKTWIVRRTISKTDKCETKNVPDDINDITKKQSDKQSQLCPLKSDPKSQKFPKQGIPHKNTEVSVKIGNTPKFSQTPSKAKDAHQKIQNHARVANPQNVEPRRHPHPSSQNANRRGELKHTKNPGEKPSASVKTNLPPEKNSRKPDIHQHINKKPQGNVQHPGNASTRLDSKTTVTVQVSIRAKSCSNSNQGVKPNKLDNRRENHAKVSQTLSKQDEKKPAKPGLLPLPDIPKTANTKNTGKPINKGQRKPGHGTGEKVAIPEKLKKNIQPRKSDTRRKQSDSKATQESSRKLTSRPLSPGVVSKSSTPITTDNESNDKSSGPTPPTKVIVRLLPPNLTKEEFFEGLYDVPKYNYFFIHNPTDQGLGPCPWPYSTVFINFLTPQAAESFMNQINGKPFFDSTNWRDYFATCDLALFQRVPNRGCRNPRRGTLYETEDYKRFLQSLEDEKDKFSGPTITEMLDSLENRKQVPRAMPPLVKHILNSQISIFGDWDDWGEDSFFPPEK